MQIETVGVVGCGLMGHGIAQIAAQGGHKVIVAEADQDALDKGLARIDAGLQDSGPRQLSWDGRDETGLRLSPGLYLLSIDLQTQFTQTKQLLPLGVAY